MVLYFSATGNTKFIAESIAKKLGDGLLDLLPRIKEQDFSPIRSKKPFVICCPVYVCEMPKFLIEYLKRVRLEGNRLAYFVFTCGGYAGISGNIAADIVNRKRMFYMGRMEITMPNNYAANDHYAANPPEEILYRIQRAEYMTSTIALDIKNKKKLRARHVYFFEKLVTAPFTPIWIRTKQPSKPFYATDKCVGCGRCVKLCPLNNISLGEDKKPVWKAPCAHCMACICNCPTEAIEYGNITQNKEKYNIRKYLPEYEKIMSQKGSKV